MAGERYFGLSTAYAGLRARLLEGRHGAVADAARGTFGMLIYLVNFYGFTALFPWFAEARSCVQLVTHVAWGLVVPVAYGMLVQQEARRVPSTMAEGAPG